MNQLSTTSLLPVTSLVSDITKSKFMNTSFTTSTSMSFVKLKLNSLLRSIFVLIIALGFVGGVNAQFAVTTNGGSGLAATYPSLAAAITALNVATISSPVVITCPTGTETSPAGGYDITAVGTAVNTIIIQGAGATNSIITAPNPAGTSGALNDAIFKLRGADYVTIDGFSMLENAANTITAAGTNNMIEWGVALLYNGTTNGAQNNTISNNIIDLNRTYQNTFGIYSNSTHSATTVTTSATATTAAGGNSGMKVYGNTITDVNQGIVVVGPTAAADQNTGIDIGGTGGGQANSITNWGTTGTFSGYANVSGTVNGILVRNSNGYNLSFNTITSSAGGTTSGTLNGIQQPAATNAPTGAFTNTINSNNISLQSAVSGGAINGINIIAGSASTTSTLNVNSNNFGTTGHTVAASGVITFIINVSTHNTTSFNSNTFTNITVNTTGSVTFISNSITPGSATGSKQVNGNSIVTAFSKTGAGGTIALYTDGGSSTSTTAVQNNNNNFSNITVTGATTITGWFNNDGTGSTPQKTITGNTFSNWTCGTSSVIVLQSNFGNPGSISTNTISNITGQGAITGLLLGSSGTTSSLNLSSNTISGLTSTGASGAVIGISTSNTATTVNINKNTICDLSGSNAVSTVTGILVSAGTTVNLSNNRIGDLRTIAASGTNPVIGLNITGGTTVNCYYNSVNLSGTSSAALFGSSAISAVTASTLLLNNNIFTNSSTPKGAGLAVAYRRSSATLATYATASNRNDFSAATLFSDGATNITALGTYKTFVGPSRDANSISESPSFTSTICGATFLKINTGMASGLESGGGVIAGITDDFENDFRFGHGSYAGSGTAPDIGADEFEGTPSSVCMGTPASSTITGATAVCTGTGTTLSLSTVYTDLNITYQWSSGTTMGGPYSTTLGTSATQATGNLTVPTYYICVITCTSSGLSFTTSEKSVLVNALPTITVNGLNAYSASYCNPGGSPVALTAGGANTYSWSPATGLSATTGASVTASPSITTTYTVTGTDVNGCISTASAAITVAATPQNVIAAATPTTICSGSTSNLTSSAFNPTTANNYIFATSTGAALDPMTGATTVVSASTDDAPMNTTLGANTNAGASVALPFTFNYDGANYTFFSASPDGWIKLSNSNAVASEEFTNATTSSANIPKIYAFWDDLATGTTGNVKTLVIGTAPNRIFVVQWFVTIPRSLVGAANSTFQAWLYESSNKIELRYGTMGVPTSGTISAGMTGSPSANFNSITFSSNTASNSSANDVNTTKPASGRMYTFSPSGTFTYAWSPAGSVVNPTSQNTATLPLSMTTLFTVTVTNGGCPATASATVTVDPLTCTPPSAISANCEGANFTVTAHPAGGGAPYSYSWSDGVGGVYPNAQIITANLAAGMYTFAVTITDACLSTCISSVTVTINPNPASTVVTGGGEICGSSTTLNASNGNDGTMYYQGTSSNGTSTATPSSSQVISVAGTYYFRAQSAFGCWGPEGSATVSFATPPTSSGATICQNGSGSLSSSFICPTIFTNAGTTISGTWVAATDPIAKRPTSSIVNASACSFDGTITRNYVAKQFQVSVTGNYIFEMNNNAGYDGMGYIYTTLTPGTCGTWVRGDDDSGSGSSEPKMGAIGVGDGVMTLTAGITYTLISTTYSATSGTFSGSFTWTITPPGGGQIMLPGAPGDIQWWTAASGGFNIGSGTPFNPVGVVNSPLANTNTPGTTVFYAACSTAPNCRTATDFVINALPTATISYTGSPFSTASSPVPVNQIGSPNTGTYSSTAGLIIDAITGTITPSSSTVGMYTVTYTVAAAGGCPEYTTTTMVEISAACTPPSAPTAGNVTACFDGNAHTGSATAGVGESIVWYDASTGGNVTSAPGGTVPGTYTAYAEAVNNTTLCVSSTRTSVTVTINPLPSAPTAGNVTACFDGNPHTGSATAGGGESIVWYDASTGGNVTSAPGGTVAGTYTAYAQAVSNTTGCVSSTRTLVTVTINALPTASISYSGSPYCATGTASVAQTGQGGGTYSSTGGLVINSSTGAINLGSSTPGTYTVTYSFTDGTCSNTTTASVTINATPTATISYTGSPFSTGSLPVMVNQAGSPNTGTYSSTAGLTINMTTGTITPATSTVGTYTVTYTVAAAGGCPLYTTTTMVQIVNASCSVPTIQASNLIFSNVQATSMDVSWTDGNGAGQVVVINATNSHTPPTNGTSPTANTNYSGSGEQVIYNGTGNTVHVTGLSQNTTYWFRAFEYCTPGFVYNSNPVGTNPLSQATPACIAPAGLTYTSNNVVYCQNVAITANNASLGAGSPTVTYGVSPALPAGLNLNTSTGQITGTPTTATAMATYTVTATNGCGNTSVGVVITVVGTPSVPVITATESTCQAGCALSGGQFNVISACGAGTTLTYYTDISGNTTTGAPTYNQTTPMTIYYACVSDIGGCRSAIQSLTTVPGTCINPAAGITNNSVTTILTCATTSISVTATGGVSYAWTGGATPTTAANSFNAPGTYTVTVTAANGCTDIESIAISQDIAAPTAGITNNTGTTVLTCTTTSISVIATGGGTYLWTGGSTTAAKSFSSPGTYTVTVTAANGCTATASITITQDITAPSAGITNNSGTTILTCATTSISVTATGGVSYAWDGGATPLMAANSFNTPGTYTVTATGANGCTAMAGLTITQDITPPIAAIVFDSGTSILTCTNPSLSFTAVGGGTYLWTGGATTAANSFSTPGTYTVTVTAANGCTATSSVNVTQDITPPTAGITNNSGTGILTCTTTSINATASGGVSYAWSGGATPTTDVNSFNAPGTYIVTVTAANGCTATASITITQDIIPPTAGITNNSGSTVLTCATTSISVTATGGVTYSWSGGATPLTAANSFSAPGTYTVTVTGANGCTATASITITQNITPPTAGITNNSGTTVLTCTTTSISVTATGVGTYSWSGGATPLTAANSFNAPGTYTVTVTAANGCTATASITITQDITAPTAGITNNTGSTVLNCTTTSISVTATGGASYAWDGGVTPTAAANSFSESGTYTVTVTGPNGCTSTANIVITQDIATPTAGITNNTGSTVLNCTTTSISVTATGGGTYLWTGGATTAANSFNAPGTYTVTVTAANGCTATASISITQDITTPIAGITNNTGTTVLNCTTTSISVTATGGGTYLWTGGVTTAANSFSSPGTYTVTVTAANGCTATASITITQDIATPTAGITNNTGTTILNCTTTSISVTATGGGTYLWTGGATTAANSFNAPGTYTVTVTAANGCTATASIMLLQDINTPTAGITNNTGTTVLTCTTTSISVTATGGGTYLWTGGATTAANSFSSPGTYTVTVTGSNGCTSTANIVITQNITISYTWNSSTGNWTTASNWIPTGVPGVCDNAYVPAGTVIVSGNQQVVDLTFASGSTLKGSGTLTINGLFTNNGTIAPGNSPGCLTINANVVNSILDVEIGGTTVCTQYDQLIVNGTFTAAGSSFNLMQYMGYVPTGGEAFTIVNNDMADPIIGIFVGFAEGATITNFLGSSLDATISYVGGDGNDIVITVETTTLPVHNITQNTYFNTIEAAINDIVTVDGDVIEVAAVTLAQSTLVDVNKSVTIQGQGINLTTVELSSAWFNTGGTAFTLSAPGITIKDIHFKIVGKGAGNILGIFQSNTIVEDNKFSGEYVFGDGEVTRAAVWSANNMTGLVFDNNIIQSLRQPGYLSNGSGTISNNTITTTRGWVIEGIGTMSITGNTFNSNTSHITILDLASNITGLTISDNDLSGAVTDWRIDNRAGTLNATCNWYGSTDYTTVESKIKGRVVFVPYSSSAAGPCGELNAIPDNLSLQYTKASENIQVQFDVAQNDMQLRAIPGLNPAIPGDLAQIVSLYNDLKVAIAGGVTSQIQAAALAVGDDIITEYYYLNGLTKVYLKTAGGNDLIKNKYWQEYLVRTLDNERFPDWANNETLVTPSEYATSTNPMTGAVSAGWLDDVLGKDLHVDVTFVHNGTVTTSQEIVAIDPGPVNVYSALPIGPGTFVSTHNAIQEAINDPLTLNGYIITVDAGTYAEHVIINKSLDLRGPNYGISGTGVRGPEALIVPEANFMPGSPFVEVVNIDANNVSFNGFKVSGDNPAITGYSYAGMDLEKGQGVYSEGNNVTFSNNIVEKATTMGFYAGGGLPTPTFTDLLVINNKFENIHDLNQLGYGFAMYIQATTGAITNNTVLNSRTGIQVQPYQVVQNVFAPEVTGNTFNAWRSGIYYNYAENNATAWTISGNTVNAIAPPSIPVGPVRWQGIAAETIRASSNGGTISGNTVNGNNISDPSTWWAVNGLQYAGNASTSTAVNFAGNTVTGVKTGFVHDAVADIVFTGNNLTASEKAISVQRSFNSAAVEQPFGGTNNIDATGGNTYNGVASGGATLSQLFTIEDAINHKVDESFRGLVRVKSNELYVTINSFITPGTTAPSLQRGIDAASNGNIVNIGPGVYAENVLVNKELEINGAGTGLTTIVPAIVGATPPGCGGSDCVGASNVIKLAANNIHLHDFTIDGNNPSLTSGIVIGGQDIDARNGIIADGTSGRYNIEINDIEMKNIYLRGIYPQYTSNMNIHDNAVSNVRGGSGSIAIFSWASSGNVSNNSVSEANDAIAANHSMGITFSGNDVSNSDSGIHSDNNGDGSPSTPDVITGNTVSNGSGAGSYGIFVFAPYLNTIISENTITNVAVGLATTGAQIGSPTVNVTGNTISNTTAAGAYITTQVWGYGDGNNNTVFTNNFLTNNPVGIEIEAITGFTNNLVANNNSLTGNATGITKTGSGTFTENLQCNWWGSATAPGVAAAVGAGTNYTPWLTNGTDDAPGTPGFQPVTGACVGGPLVITSVVPTASNCNGAGTITVTWTGGDAPFNIGWTGGSASNVTSPYVITGLAPGLYNILVTDLYLSLGTSSATILSQPVINTTSNTTYFTIQAAVNAATAGDVIKVCSGLYNEEVLVNKSLTINGANVGTAGNAVRVPESNIDGNNGAHSGFVITAPNVTIDGFKVQNCGSGIYQSGIYTSSTGTLIKNNVLFNNEKGVYPSNTGASTVENNLFDSNNRPGSAGGVALYSFTSNGLSVLNNEFKGQTINSAVIIDGNEGHSNLAFNFNYLHDNDPASSCVYVADVTGGEFANNLITNGNRGFKIAGGNSNINIHNNIISGTGQADVMVNTDFGANTGIQAHDNSLTGTVSIRNEDVTVIDATCNWYGTLSPASKLVETNPNTITYIPYTINGTDDQPGTPGFQPVAGSCIGSPVVIVSAIPSPATCASGGEIVVTWTGGVGPYDIAWTGGSQTNVTSPYTITGLSAGLKSITVTDALASSAITSATVTSQPVTNTTTNTTYATIQAAINAAVTGDVINVCAGTYKENLFINKGISVIGAGRDVTIVTAAIGTAPTLKIKGNDAPVMAGNVLIDGLSFTDNDTKFHQYIVTTDHIPATSTLTFQNNRITNGDAYGFWGYHDHGTLLFANNIVSDVSYGMLLEGWDTAPVTVDNNEFTNLHLFRTNGVPSASAPVGLLAMTYSGSGGVDCNNPYVISNNKLYGFAVNGSGILFYGGLLGNVKQYTNVEIASNEIAVGINGILLRNYSNTTNDPLGGVVNANIHNNTVDGNTKGLYVLGLNPGTNAHMNSFAGSVTYSIQNTGSGPGENVNATCNWYGSTVSATIAAKISGNVTYSPWLLDGSDGPGTGFQPMGACAGSPIVITSAVASPMTCAAQGQIVVTWTGGVSPFDIAWTGGSATGVTSPYTIMSLAPGIYSITVTDVSMSTATASATVLGQPVKNTTTMTTYATIQDAINAASPGDVIDVCAGTYPGTITIDRSLTLRGAKVGVDPRPSVGSSRVIGGSGESRLVAARNQKVININADNVIIDGFEITQIGGAGAATTIETNTNHAGVTFKNNIVTNTTTSNAMRLYGGQDFLIERNYFNDIPGEGIVLRNGNLAIPVATNQKIRNNDIVNQYGVAGGAIYTYGQSGMEIFGNIINAKYQGIAVGADGPVYYFMQDIDVHHNDINLEMATIASQDYGIIINGLGDNINIHNNKIVDISSNTGSKYVLIKVSFDALSAAASNPQNLKINNNFLSRAVANNYLTVGTNVTNPIDAECNWWNSTNSGVIASYISAPVSIVDYSPWLVNGADTDGGAPGFVPNVGACSGSPVVINSLVTTGQTCNTLGSITVNFSGGLTPYTIAWTGGIPVTGVVGSPYVITGLAAGNYSVTVTDMNGSNAVSSTTIVSFPVANITATTVHTTIQAAIDAASPGDVLQVCAGTYTENINVNKALTINGPNVGIAGTAVRGAEAILSDCDIDITAAGNVTMDGFKVYQTNANSDVVSISGGTNATVQNSIFERFGTLTGQFVRAITTSSGAGLQTIQNNLFTGDVSGGLFGGHKTWQAAIYVNGAASTVLIQNNTFQNIRGALNLDDYQSGIQVVGNTFTNNGTHMSFGGVVPTTGSYVMGSNALQVTAFTTLFNLSNVNPNFRLDVTSSTFNGAVANTLPLASLFNIEAFMFHRGRSGRNGLVTYVANNEYVTSFALTTIQSAVDYASPGFVINLQSGNYNESAIVNKSVTIDGETSLCSDVVINGGGVRAHGVQILANTTNVILKDFKILNTVGAGGGIDAFYGNDGLNIDNVCLENTAGLGAIKLQGPVNGVTINNCEVWGPGVNGRGIVIWDDFKQNITITNNKVHDIGGCCGIELQDGNASAVTMTGNMVTKSGDSGMSAVGLNGTVGPNNISGNTITDCGRFGLEIKNPNGSTLVDGNTVSITTAFSALKPSELRDIAGIAVIRRGVTAGNPDYPSGVTVTNNTITGYIQDNGASQSEGFGIVIEGINHLVSSNTINLSDVGVQFQAKHMPYPGDGDQSNLSDQYFGRGNSQETCANILGSNTFNTVGTNTRSIGVGYGLVTNTNTSKIFCSIQAAIDDAATMAGDIITVAAGTYKEDVVVNKSLTITGPNAGISGCDPRGPEAIIVPATDAIASGEIFHVTASNVTISGFTIDGDNTDLTSGFLGTNGADINAAEGVTVYVANVNNLTVTNNIFRNLSYFGVTLDGGSGSAPATSGHNISNNKFTDLGTYDAGSGINLWGGGVLLYNNQYAAVNNNCMTNVRLGVQTGNFSQANTGAVTYQKISGNTIQTRKIGIFHNLFYSLSSPYDLANNTITGLANAGETTNWTGILLASLSQTVHTSTNNNVDGSAIAITKTGISVWNDLTAPLISGGTITGVGIGINVNNFEGYPSTGSDANNTAATITGTTITGATIAGVKVHDNPANSNGATVTATVGNTNTITGSPVGVWVVGSDATATVMGNNFTGNQVDIQVAANTGVVVASPNNNLSGSNFGIENLSANVINGTLNYWNDLDDSGPGAVGTGTGVNVSTNVNFCPWLDDFAPAGVPVSASPGAITVSETGGPTDNDGSICASEPVTLTVVGAKAGSTYLWSTGATTASIGVNPAVTTIYSVTVSYGGCSTVLNTTITVYPVPAVQLLAIQDVLCYGGNTGQISVTGSVGPPAYSYIWSNGATSAAITGLIIGDYTVTVTDANQCSANATYTIAQPPVLSVINYIVTNETCQPCNDGTIAVNATGGTAPYQYSKDGGMTFQMSNSFTGLMAGSYSMVVKDANGCQTTSEMVIITENGVYPDLTPSTVISSSQFNIGSSSNQVVFIRNVGTGPTSAPVVFRVTKFVPASGMTIVQNVNPSVVIFGDTYVLNNSDFDMVDEGGFLRFTSKPGVVIAPAQALTVGFVVARTGGGKGTLTASVNIVNGTGGGELNTLNNVISNYITKL